MALYACGFSINQLTLLSLVLSIGLVVDDAIVVLENCQRRTDLGEPPLLAATRGTRQVAFAVIATTVVLIAVFLPIAFMISAFTQRKVRKDVAMTGEITLRGEVLPIGGVKEKVLAARAARITTIVLPKMNRRDATQISSRILHGLTFRYVENMGSAEDITYDPMVLAKAEWSSKRASTGSSSSRARATRESRQAPAVCDEEGPTITGPTMSSREITAEVYEPPRAVRERLQERGPSPTRSSRIR